MGGPQEGARRPGWEAPVRSGRGSRGVLFGVRLRPRRRFRLTLDPRGQSLVEFAISAPVVLLMILFGVDFGRVFLGWVTLSNAARAAANFAALNPTAWGGLPNLAAQAEFSRLINAESTGINCTMPSPLPTPTFPNGNTIGSPAVVAITCRFSLITPIVANVLGNSIPVSVEASFPIRSGVIAGVPTSSNGTLPSLPPTTAPTPSVDPTATPFPTPSTAPTATPTCTVPDYLNTNTSQATRTWTDAGFLANNLTFNPLVPPNYKIKHQSITAGTPVACTITMAVTP